MTIKIQLNLVRGHTRSPWDDDLIDLIHPVPSVSHRQSLSVDCLEQSSHVRLCVVPGAASSSGPFPCVAAGLVTLVPLAGSFLFVWSWSVLRRLCCLAIGLAFSLAVPIGNDCFVLFSKLKTGRLVGSWLCHKRYFLKKWTTVPWVTCHTKTWISIRVVFFSLIWWPQNGRTTVLSRGVATCNLYVLVTGVLLSVQPRTKKRSIKKVQRPKDKVSLVTH